MTTRTPVNLRRLIAIPLLTYLGIVLVAYNSMLHGTALLNHGNDFGKFYYATQSWLADQSLYAPTIATHMAVGSSDWQEFADLNPPHFHLIVVPFTLLPLALAADWWLALNALSAASAFFIVITELKIRMNAVRVLTAAVGVLLCAATGATVITGQFTGLLLLLAARTWKAMRTGHQLHAGLTLGTLISVKPFLALVLLVPAARREARTLLFAMLALVTWGMVGLAVFGRQAHWDWLRSLRSVNWLWQPMNGSIEAVLIRTLDRTPYNVPLALYPGLVVPLWLLACTVVGYFTLRASLRSVDHGLGLATLASLLISPLGWIYYAWLALPPCLSLWRTSRPLSASLGLLLMAVPLPLVLAGQSSAFASATLGSCYTYALLALWIGLVRTPGSDGPRISTEGLAGGLPASRRDHSPLSGGSILPCTQVSL